jgi:hypothetical protein
MAITVGTTLTRVAMDLHEESNLFSVGLWSLEEMIGYVNYAETDFMRRTGILKYDQTQVALPAATRLFTKPTGAMTIERMSFDAKRLRRQTSWDLEREDPEWRNLPPGPPRYWHEDHLPVNEFELDRVPSAGGSLRIFYDMVPADHELSPDGLLEDLIVPDTWEPYVRWEIIALALGRDGDNQDIQRSNYAHQRYLLGVALAKRLVVGPMNLPIAVEG